jgi:GT2 family glycosyltransferase
VADASPAVAGGRHGSSDQPIVAALLLNYRGADMTLQCVRDLLAVTDVPLSIVVMDNHSGEDEVAQLQQGVADLPRGLHEVHVLPSPENLGFAGGMNRGIEFAARQKIPFVLVLNNDMRLPKGFVLPLLDVLRNDPAVGAVGPTVVHPDGTVWAEGGELGFLPNGLRLIRHGQLPSDVTDGPAEVGFLTGACMMMRTDAAGEVGGFDRDYFMYWEDVEISSKLRRRGLRIVWLPWVRVQHLGGQSSGGGRSPLRKFFMACNAVRYLKAHGSAKAWAGWLVFDVLLWPITFAMGPAAAWAKMRGTMAGLSGHKANANDVVRFLDEQA